MTHWLTGNYAIQLTGGLAMQTWLSLIIVLLFVNNISYYLSYMLIKYQNASFNRATVIYKLCFTVRYMLAIYNCRAR